VGTSVPPALRPLMLIRDRNTFGVASDSLSISLTFLAFFSCVTSGINDPPLDRNTKNRDALYARSGGCQNAGTPERRPDR